MLKYGLIPTRIAGEAFWSCDATTLTSYGHVMSSVTSPFHSPWPLSYRLPVVTYLLSPLVSEIFDLKITDIQTEFHANWHDSKVSFKLSTREPIKIGWDTQIRCFLVQFLAHPLEFAWSCSLPLNQKWCDTLISKVPVWTINQPRTELSWRPTESSYVRPPLYSATSFFISPEFLSSIRVEL